MKSSIFVRRISHFPVQFRVKLNDDHAYALHFSSPILPTEVDEGNKMYPLYPYQSTQLAVIFVYGIDYERQTNVWFIPKSTQIVFISVVLFVSLAAIILSFIRRKGELRGDGLITSHIDSMVVFTAGGNLRMHHNWERWFFGIMLIGAFFIVSIFTGDLLSCVYRTASKIGHFEQLAETNAPFYIHPIFTIQADLICGMLRFGHRISS